MAKKYTSFKEFFASETIEFHKEVETAVHNDENIANNRLFVWNFEEIDLEEFLKYFQVYKNSPINIVSRQTLSGNLMRKMNSMLREGYNPIECMLYASKTINMKLQNDKELQDILAERIKDMYLKEEAETIAVLENIIKMWTWVPQVSVVIAAVGLIGDNQELLDSIMINYAEDPYYKIKVFYALMKNKSLNNLERAMKIVMNLQDSEEDNILGKVFIKEIGGFGYEGNKLVAKYYENPGVSRIGGKVLKKIMLKDNTLSANVQDDLYRRMLANKSTKDELAYKDFVNDCYEKYDDNAFYLSRFSRPDIGSFLKDALEDDNLSPKNRNTAIVSLGIAGAKGYMPAAAILNTCERKGGNEYAVVVASIILGDAIYVTKLVDMFCTKKDFELSELYGVLRDAGFVNYKSCVRMVEEELEKKFRMLLETEDYEQLDCLTSNFQMFWNKKLYSLLSKQLLEQMQEVLLIYAQNEIPMPQTIVISIIETIVHSWNKEVEKVMFTLYNQSANQKVQEVSFKKLKTRKIEEPE